MKEYSVSSRLRKTMHEKRINCIQLSQSAKVKPSFLYDILNGKSANPSALQLAKVARALNISLSYLAGTSKLRSEYPSANNHDSVYITLPRITFEKKQGKIISQIEKAPHIKLQPSWLEETLGISINDAKLYTIDSDEMAPALLQGDTVLIDTKCTHAHDDGMFLIFDGTKLIVRRLVYSGYGKNKSISLLCDNPNYSLAECALDDILIIGRISWLSRAC